MDKALIKEFGLTEAVNRFKQLNEYTFITAPLLSEDDDDEQDPAMQQPQGDPNAPQQDQQMPQQQMPMGQGQQMPPQDPMQGQDPNAMAPDQGGPMPMDQGGFEDVDMENPDVEPMQPDDEVIDVDDLTNAQEETEFKLDGVEQKLGRLLNVVDKFTVALQANDQKITELADEFKKRNPTETEKLNIRSQAAAPYTESPKDYWDQKSATDPRYQVMFNNGVPTSEEQREFEIRQSDVDNYNERDISKSFGDLRLSDYFGI
ncbi:MAG: hypothetical protein LUD72_04765 [Bacteroidales bacterium]|nr:hypothetical protein [Bacteroidales bacterium]